LHKKYLSYFVNEDLPNWKEILLLIVAASNNLPHSSVNSDPHEIFSGRNMSNPFDVNIESKNISDLRVLNLVEKINLYGRM
jgi:hypothetical protein